MEQEKIEELQTYKEFVRYLAEETKGFTDEIIEAFYDSDFVKFCGYINAKRIFHKGDPCLKFNYEAKTYIANWQSDDNYGVWQRGHDDSYYGYLLFPTKEDGRYFLLEYEM